VSDDDILLAAIAANRDDDAPRLAYADWLQENGYDAKAELIRLEYRARQSRVSIETVNVCLEAMHSEVNADWLLSVFSYFALVFHGCPRYLKIPAIKTVREMTNNGLLWSKNFVEGPLPAAILKGISHSQAKYWLERVAAENKESRRSYEQKHQQSPTWYPDPVFTPIVVVLQLSLPALQAFDELPAGID
jgi:uncharacterized protein (TIGR02996 family)